MLRELRQQKRKAERQGMKRYIKPVATGIGVFLFLLSGTFLTTGGFKINNAEAAKNSQAAVQNALSLLLLFNDSSTTEITIKSIAFGEAQGKMNDVLYGFPTISARREISVIC
ncbi:MAG: hypothetical protein D3919_07575 [Candidatus Electrothrix sp. AW5]|nr:hypothetical protein [Candidatus Electrothrix gigas]